MAKSAVNRLSDQKTLMKHSKAGNKNHDERRNKKGLPSDEIRALKEEVLVTIRNGLVFPNTILQIGRDRQLTFEESDDASKCIYTVIANVEQKFFNFQNRHPS